jgi:hypothetical protein
MSDFMCCVAVRVQAMLQRQRLAAEAVEQEQKEEEFHLQQAQVRTPADTAGADC